MKTKLSVIAVAVGLLYAAVPAFAGDSASVTQEGVSSAATITQVGNSGTNNAAIAQGQPMNGGGNNEVATISQLGVSASEALVYQWGNTNQTYVTQINSTDAHVNNVQNWGDANFTQINQSNVNGAHVAAFQNGNSNAAYFNQHDGGNLTATVNTNDPGVDPAYGAHGQYNLVSIDQSGWDASASVQQGPGEFNAALITQVGYGGMNTANVTQRGSYSLANVTQVGSNFTANVTQNAQQPGTGNVATIYQHF